MLDSTRRAFIGATVLTLLSSCSTAVTTRLLKTQSGGALLLENGDRLIVS